MASNFVIKFKDVTESFNVIFKESGGSPSGEEYTGPYKVTPKAYNKQTLNTANKVLTKDIQVEEIPYHAVINKEDGVTVSIAGED